MGRVYNSKTCTVHVVYTIHVHVHSSLAKLVIEEEKKGNNNTLHLKQHKQHKHVYRHKINRTPEWPALLRCSCIICES